MKRENGNHKFWIRYTGARNPVGIKVFPRVGSSTLRHTYGYGDSCKAFMTCKQRAVVVRNPWDRLMSVYFGMLTQGGLGVNGYPPSSRTSINGLLQFLIDTPDPARDWHTRSMTGQLMGYAPTDAELWDLKAFVADPPYGLVAPNTWSHKTNNKPPIDVIERVVDPDLREAWRELYDADWQLWYRSKKL